MEGLFGILSINGQADQEQLRNMARTLGMQPKVNFFYDGQCGLGVQRLPLIDKIQTSEPVLNKDGSLCVILNGEIINYHELRSDLEHRGYEFVSHSDGELVANLYLDKGEKFLKELNGLFVLAIWDRQRQDVILAQDRYGGIRQLYYAQLPNQFIFASGIRPILASEKVIPEVDTDSLVEFFSIGRVLPPHCLFKGIQKLIPGHILKCHKEGLSTKRIYGFSFAPKIKKDDTPRLEEYFSESIEKNLTSDRPLGFLLSGGLDSSLNIAMASRLCNQPVDTFSLGFANSVLDESYYSHFVAEHFKTNHHEHFLESGSALEILPQLTWCQEEPISDYSAVPSYHLARFVKTFVDVVISGDGPDHLFGRSPLSERRRFACSLPGQQLLKKLLLNNTANRLAKYYPVKAAQRLAEYTNKTVERLYIEALARSTGNTSSIELVPRILSESLQPGWLERIDPNLFLGDATDDFGCQVTCDFLIDGSFGVFAKFGKVAAEQSLLVREPYFENSLVDYINCLPDALKRRGNLQQRLKGTAVTKYMMRRDLGSKLLPQAVLTKRKAGFTPPMNQWLQEYLDQGRINVNTLLGSSLKQAELFNTAYVKNLIEGCQNKSWPNNKSLYMLLLFAVWHRLYIDKFTAASPTATLTELLNE